MTEHFAKLNSPPKRLLKVFLCHASGDKPKVRELYRYLKRRGIQPWLDAEDLLPGQNWQVEIPKAIETSDAIIICLSKSSVNKEGYIQKEIKFSLNKALEIPDGRIFIIPVRLDDCDVPFTLKSLHWVDLFNREGTTKLLKSLRMRAQQLELASIQLPVASETELNPSENLNQTLLEVRVALKKLLNESDKLEEQQKLSSKLKTKNKSVVTIVIILGVLASIFASFLHSPLTEKVFNPMTTPSAILTSLPTFNRNFTITPTSTLISTSTFMPTMSPTLTSSPTMTPQLGYTIVDPSAVFVLSDKVKALGQLAKEKYTPDDRNKVNQTLTYTIEATRNTPMFWRWYWCAATEKILDQNLKEINVLFEADGRLLKAEQLATVKFIDHSNDWWCFTYSTVLKDWKPGTYHLIQTMTIKSAISDGKDSFPSGYKIAKFTITIH